MQRVQESEKLRLSTEKLGCTMTRLALAWVMANPDVSTVITGSTTVAQLDE